MTSGQTYLFMGLLKIKPGAISKTFAFLLFALLVSISGCSSSGGSSSPSEPNDNANENANTNGDANGENNQQNADPNQQETENQNNTPIDTSGYDFADYQFGSSVRTAGGEVSFADVIYGQTDENDSILRIQRRFANPTGNKIDEYSAGELVKSFVINSGSIDETLFDNTGTSTRQTLRYLNTPGMVYMDADSEASSNLLGGTSQNATCTFIQHLDSFDLSTATGDKALASGVFNDIIEAKCETGFVSPDGTKQPHTILTSYFAKDVGVIFSTGSLFLFGDVYIVHEY